MHSCQKPIMIFSCTRNSCAATAKELARLWNMTNPPSRLWKGPGRQIQVNNEDLNSMASSNNVSDAALTKYSNHRRWSRIPPCRPWSERQTCRRTGFPRWTHKRDMLHFNPCRRREPPLSPCNNQKYRRLAGRWLQRIFRPRDDANARTCRSTAI